MDLQFPGDVPAMSNDRIGGDAQMIGNLLIGHALHQCYYHILLTITEGIRILSGTTLENHIGDILRHPTLLGRLFQASDGRYEDMILHLRMLAQPFLIVIDIMKRRCQLVVVQSILWKVFDNEEFQLT